MDKSHIESVGGLAGIGGPVGSMTPIFVSKLQSPTMLKPEYCVQDDIITDNIIIPGSSGKLEKKSSSYLNNKRIKMFKYIGSDPNRKMMTILNNINKPATREFVYESITNKIMLDDSQIEYDESFKEVNFNEIKMYIENDAYSTMSRFMYYAKPYIADNIYSKVINEESSLLLNRYRCNSNVCIMEDKKLGYFAINKKTLRRTKFYDDIKDIVISSDIKDGDKYGNI